MTITFGILTVAARQKCSAAFAGVTPKQGTKEYLPKRYVGSRFDYVDPDDYSLDTLSQGGLYDFGEDNSVIITEIRAFVGATKTITVAVCDRDGSNSVTLLSAVDGNAKRHVFPDRMVVLPTQVVKVSSTAAGLIDLYAVKGDSHL